MKEAPKKALYLFYNYVEIEKKKSVISVFTGIQLSPERQAIAKQLLCESL